MVAAQHSETSPFPSWASESGAIALGALSALLSTRKAAVAQPAVIAVEVLEEGAYTLDLGAESMLRPGAPIREDLRIVTNAETLADLLMGRFNPAQPEAKHLFLVSGDPRVLRSISAALRGGQSWLSARIGSMSSSSSRSRRSRRGSK